MAKERPGGSARADTGTDDGAAEAAPAEAGAAGRGASRAGGASRDTAARPPYEKARDELASLVKRLEAGGLTLEQSLELWERGEQLADICEEWLEGARARLATAVARREERSGRDGQDAAAAGPAETPF